jgi:hypothetical protein
MGGLASGLGDIPGRTKAQTVCKLKISGLCLNKISMLGRQKCQNSGFHTVWACRRPLTASPRASLPLPAAGERQR